MNVTPKNTAPNEFLKLASDIIAETKMQFGKVTIDHCEFVIQNSKIFEVNVYSELLKSGKRVKINKRERI